MRIVPVTRAALLTTYIDVLRELGMPVERELTRAKIPAFIEEQPNSYVSKLFKFNFVRRCAHLEGIDDLGFHAARRLRFTSLGSTLVHDAYRGLTLYQRLRRVTSLIAIEDNTAQVALVRRNGGLQVVLDQARPWSKLECSEWQKLFGIIEIVRNAALPDWLPKEISIKSDRPLCDQASNYFSNTRVLRGRPVTSITLPSDLLAATRSPNKLPEGWNKAGQPEDEATPTQLSEFVGSLRCSIRPYLSDGHVSIALAAEMAGTSVRSLQRALTRLRLSYSDILEQTRFEAAATLLRNRDVKVIDVAMAVGYDDPSHFARAFRRVHGLSPREFQRVLKPPAESRQCSYRYQARPQKLLTA